MVPVNIVAVFTVPQAREGKECIDVEATEANTA